ncbi:MAG TPA: ribbon-helix-helix domain-containing protein [Methanosarcinales archaeon]|nr:ribbon-helix-helix domain-containing protein [Methanosarcinales archaeon]
MAKRQVCFTIEEEVVKKMEEIRENTGVPVSKQIELALKGYKIEKVEEK